MASGNLKDLSKAAASYLSSATLPLPEDLSLAIDSFVQKHKTHDDQCAAALHDELIALHRRLVIDPAETGRTPAFIAVVHPLAQNLRSESRLRTWYAVAAAFLDSAARDRDTLPDWSGWIQPFLSFGDGEDDPDPEAPVSLNPLAERLIAVWIADYYAGYLEGNGVEGHCEKMVRDAILQYGKRRPRRFFTAVDGFFVGRETRKAAITLIMDLIQSQPPHLHMILRTPLFGNILCCLQNDTSTTLVSAALTLLTMLLPHMPSGLAPHLPTLFNVYARLLFWSRNRSSDLGADVGAGAAVTTAPISATVAAAAAMVAGTGTGSGTGAAENGDVTSPSGQPPPRGWDVYAYSPEHDGLQVARLGSYFTVLYGLYPINLMDYIRKPQRYLRHTDVASPYEDPEVEPTEIRQKSEPLRQCHLLHPNFYTMTVESERTDFGRWIKSEPADITAECMALWIGSDAVVDAAGVAMCTDLASSLGDDGDNADPALLSGSVVATMDGWRSSDSPSLCPLGSQARVRSHSSRQPVREQPQQPQQPHQPHQPHQQRESAAASMDSPILAPGGNFAAASSQTQLQDMIHHNKAIKLAIHQSLPNESVTSLSLSHVESANEGATSQTAAADAAAGAATTPASVAVAGAGAAAAAPSSSDLDFGAPRVVHLQRQITLLQNDLRFERFLRQQHVAHIGSLRRKQLSELATEAEAQNLIWMNRTMQARVREAKEAEIQVRKEMERSRALSKRWEADIYAKLKAAKEEARRTKAEADSLRRGLDETLQEREALKLLVSAAEVRELGSKQALQSIEMDSSEVEHLKTEVRRLGLAESLHQAMVAEQDRAIAAAAASDSRAESLQIQLDGREAELQRIRDHYEEQISQIKAQITDGDRFASRPPRGAAPSAGVLENALAIGRAKHAETQAQYCILLKKYTALQSTLLDLRAGGGGVGGGGSAAAAAAAPTAGPGGSGVGVDSPATSEFETLFSTAPGSPARPSRTYTDPDGLDSGSIHTASSRSQSTIGLTSPLHATASWGSDGGVSVGGTVGGEGGRPQGRAGCHSTGLHRANRAPKETREKKSSGGLRGMRQFGSGSGL